MPVTKAYKYLETKYIDDMLSGKLRFTRLSVYRALEKEHGRWIGDEREYSSEVILGDIHIAEATPDVIQSINAMLAPPGHQAVFQPEPDAKNIRITGNGAKLRYVGVDDPHVFCATHGSPSIMKSTMCDNASDAKDACVRILDIEAVAQRIMEAGRLLETAETMFHMTYAVEKVKYLDTSVKQGQSMAPLSPFVKDHFFKSQREVRIAFLPKTALPLPDVITFKIEQPHKLFREEFRAYKRLS